MSANHSLFKWKRTQLDPATKELLDLASDSLSKIDGRSFRPIMHTGNSYHICCIDSIILFNVGDGGRPSEIVTIAIVRGPQIEILFPVHRRADFRTCCNILSLNQEDAILFDSFLVKEFTRKSKFVD